MFYGPKAAILLVRRSFPSLKDMERASRDIFHYFYGHQAQYNKTEHIWKMPHGGTIEFGQLQDQNDYDRYQGRSFSMLLVDEAGQFPQPDYIDMRRSNLRGAAEVPLRTVIIANPGGVGHTWLRQRYAKFDPWEVFEVVPDVPQNVLDVVGEVGSETWLNCHLTFKDNPFIDQKAYVTNLAASAPGDPELLEAWLAGSWDILRGAFFGDVIRKARCETLTPEELFQSYKGAANPRYFGQHLYIAHDWGSQAPSATYLFLESPGFTDTRERFWPKGSRIVLDEFATYRHGRLHEGTGATPSQLAEGIKKFLERWKVSPKGVADDACFAKQRGFENPSIAEEFKQHGVIFEPARKGDRITGWANMRELMLNAQSLERPGLVVDPRCRYFWDTVPSLQRDPRRPEDIEKSPTDHGGDGVRYGCLWKGIQTLSSGAIRGAH
jgi:hypothetical protein